MSGENGSTIPRALGSSVAVLVVLMGLWSPPVAPAIPGTPGPSVALFPTPGGGLPGHLPNDHIQHVITVMMENHDYDNYFGTYCQVTGPYCPMTGNGIPAGTCVPYYPTDLSAGCVVPYNLTPAQFFVNDMGHDWGTGRIAYDNGAMDGFYDAEGTTIAFGHYNQTTIPIYWDMAEEYGLADNFWGGNLSYSLPNHWYLVSGATPEYAYDNWLGEDGVQSVYLDEANSTRTIQDLLVNHSYSWKYYDTPLLPYGQAIDGGFWGSAYDFWNPMAARAETYTAQFDRHFVPRSDFLSDINDSKLPNVSWVIPDFAYSDHPDSNNSYGEAWVAELVNAVEASPYWNSTVIFITWDDYGGWYDHVPPSTVLGDLLSFRMPLLVISPYAKEGFIDHSPMDFMSLLRFVEWQFSLGCLRPLDCFAPLPLGMFDFNQPPRAPLLFGTQWDTTHYPIPLQQPGVAERTCTDCQAIDPAAWSGSFSPPPGSVGVDWS